MGQLEVMRELFGEIHTPEQVYEEVVVRGASKPGAAEVAAAAWIKRQAIADLQDFSQLCLALGKGEAAAIVLAREIGADILILDDGRARSEAKARRLNVIGTVGLLLEAS